MVGDKIKQKKSSFIEKKPLLVKEKKAWGSEQIVALHK